MPDVLLQGLVSTIPVMKRIISDAENPRELHVPILKPVGIAVIVAVTLSVVMIVPV